MYDNDCQMTMLFMALIEGPLVTLCQYHVREGPEDWLQVLGIVLDEEQIRRILGKERVDSAVTSWRQ